MCKVTFFLCVLATSCVISGVNAANILVVVPAFSSSHYVGFDVLIKELLKRGHNVTSITTFPQSEPVTNLKEVDVSPVRIVIRNKRPIIELENIAPESFFDVRSHFFTYISGTEEVLKYPDVLDLISSEDNFDLILYEMFVDDVFLGFAHKFKAPVIAMGSCYMFPWVADRFAIPANPSYIPGFYAFTGQDMNYFERVRNVLLNNIVCKLFFTYYLEPISTEIVRKYFGTDSPPVGDLIKNVSMYFMSTHFTLFGPQPLPPQVVDVSGLHLRPAKPLPQELDKWMNESSEGVIYFSFGSMLRGSTLSAEKVKAFVRVFGAMPQRVLWKWEDEAVPRDLPKNVKIMKWLPQRDILAHPKVRVFISHGGLLGTTEAVVSGVPILGIPMYGDQANNVAALVERRVAIHVAYKNISAESLSYALNTLIRDKSYSDNVRQLSRRYLDRPMSPLDTAVYWIEYVIRHRGAPHLRSAAVHLPWYQYYLLDVLVVLVASFLLIVALIYYFIKTCVGLLFHKNTAKLKRN